MFAEIAVEPEGEVAAAAAAAMAKVAAQRSGLRVERDPAARL